MRIAKKDNKMRIYLACPISGQSYDDVVFKIDSIANTLSRFGFEVWHPMTGKECLRNELEFKAQGYSNPTSTNHAIFTRDKWMVSNMDIVLAILVGAERVSIGTMMELAWASMLGKHVIVVMEKDNIHRHAFVLEAAGTVFEDTTQAIAYLKKLAGK
jgi:nucleoside 2-deoxyribosyltransferase